MQMQRSEALELYCQRTRHWIRRQQDSAPTANSLYLSKLEAEPISALFAEEVKFRVVEIKEAYNPLNAEVMSEVDITWRPETASYMQDMDAIKLPYTLLGRGGGPYQTAIANKKIKNVFKWQRELTFDVPVLWMSAYWREHGRHKLDSLFDHYERKSMENIDRLSGDPELALVGKAPNVGTGWNYPWNTRAELARHFNSGAEQFRTIVHQYYNDLRLLALDWPEKGGLISVPNPYHGTKGKRSDADIVEWANGHQVISSSTRDVGTVPDSAFFGPGLVSKEWTMETWAKFSTPYHIMPTDGEGYARIVTTQPATIPCEDDDEFAFVSADAGYHNGSLRYENGALKIGNPDVKFGADQCVLSGIMMRAGDDPYLHHFMVSGSPFTMVQYLITFGSILGDWAERHGITPSEMQVLQVGDDLQIRIKRCYIPSLIQELGPWLKVKGMQVVDGWHIVFVLGHYYCWKDGEVSMIMSPRGIKSVTSATATSRYDMPQIRTLGEWHTMRPTADARSAADDFWRLNRDYIYQLQRSPDDLYSWLSNEYVRIHDQAAADLEIHSGVDAMWH